MISFSLRNFKEHFKKPLDFVELKFLKSTFSRACGYFFGFGFALFITVWAFEIFFEGFNLFATLGFGFSSFLFSFPLARRYYMYRNNPVTATKQLVFESYAWLVVTFMTLFLFTSSILVHFLSDEKSSLWNIKLLIIVVFVTSLIVYSIPAVIAFFLASKRMVITLNKFIGIGVFIYFIISLVSIVGFIASPYRGGNFLLLIEILGFLILFFSPIITLYRLKTVVRYINHEDAEEVKRWETYFVFEIVHQLLSIALTIMKIIIRLLQASSRSRLS